MSTTPAHAPIAPSVEEFLAQQSTEHDVEAEEVELGPIEAALAGRAPLESIAESLRTLVGMVTKHSDYEELADRRLELLDDLEAKHDVVLQVIDDVEAALGKSTAKPSLAAKAVIDAWRKGPVASEPTDTERFMAGESLNPSGAPLGTDSEGNWVEPDPEAQDNQTSPAYVCPHCQTGWGEVVDPCTECGRAATGEVVIRPAAPAHDAPVGDWRDFAARMVASGSVQIEGDVQQMNRSQIRTALGIAQPVAGA